MSIHVTVNSNPLCISRSKVLLTDIELAKKNEWNRRRKLRLQQVRQQARDLASNLRRKCDDEKKLYCKQEYDENEQEFKEWQAKQLQKLQKEYDNCIAAIGSSHRTAICQAEDEENVKQKTELREALAKARGDLARERAKINAVLNKPASVPAKGSPSKRIEQKDERIQTRKPLQKSKIKPKTPVKSPESKPCSPQKKSNPITVEVRTNHPTECTILKPGISRQRQKQTTTVRRQHSCSPPSKSENLKQVTICAADDSDDSNATWPPRTARVTKTNISPQKVKFYNHDERVCKEYVKPARSVTHLEEHYNEAMEKFVEEEEEAIVKRAEVDAAVKKRSVTRGQKALNKERLEREFKSMARQLSEIDKQQRIARIFEFPYPVTIPKSSHGKDREKSPLLERTFTSKDPGVGVYQEMKKCFEIGTLAGAKKSQKKQEKSEKETPGENPFTLKNLIKDLEKERDLLLNSTLEKSPFKDLEQNCEIIQESNAQETSRRTKHESLNKASTSGKNIAVDEVIKNNEISVQTKNYVERGNEENTASDVENSESASKRSKEKRPHPIEVNVITKPLCDCCEACDCQQEQQETVITGEMETKKSLSPVLKVSVVGKRDDVKHQHPVPFEGTKEDLLAQVKSDLEDANVKQKTRSSLDKISSIRVKAKRNSCSETVGPTNSDNGIKITVTVRERNTSQNELDVKQISTNQEHISESEDNDIPWCGRLKYDNDHTNSSSSFCSPPNKLSPAQEAILNSILLKMCLKNNNPKLHKYIKRLLFMNKANIDSLAVSSPSEISIHSDVFPDIKMDPITGTYYLRDNKTKAHKKIVFSESKSQTGFSNIGTNLVKTKKTKKVVQLNTSSEESAHDERSPILKAAGKLDDSLQSNLADEYSLRLQQLIELLNQSSPRHGISELECNESSSSYVYPILSERLESNSDIAGFENNTAVVSEGEGWTFRDTLNQRNIDISNFEDQGNSSFMRNNITSLGLPFELLPKPFSLAEETPQREPLPQHKPPVSSYKYRVQGLLPHELSAIPEVSTQISCTEQEILQTRSLKQKSSELQESEYDSDVSDVSSIRPATKTTLQKNVKKKSLLEESVAGPSGLCIPSDTSSLSILSHMSNESLIEIGTDVSEKDINSFLESPSEYIEEVFSSLGVGWALSTLRKTRQSRQRDSTSTTSTSNENNNNMIERSWCKSSTKLKGSLGHSHSTPKKTVEPNYSSSSNINDELRRKFKALKNDRLSLTPPNLTLNMPPLGELNNNNSNLSNSTHLRHPKCNY